METKILELENLSIFNCIFIKYEKCFLQRYAYVQNDIFEGPIVACVITNCSLFIVQIDLDLCHEIRIN